MTSSSATPDSPGDSNPAVSPASSSDAQSTALPGARSSEAAHAALPEGLLCPDCGYDLRGLTADRCPECGFDVQPLRREESLLPWRRRRELGWLRAYWATVWLVTVRPRRLAIEIAVPQPLRDARLFWLMTYLNALAALAAAAATTTWYVVAFNRAEPDEIAAWVIGGVIATFIPWFWTLPGLATYFLQSRRLTSEHEQRVRAVSHYGWGVLAWLWAPVAFWIAAFAWGTLHHGDTPPRDDEVALVCVIAVALAFIGPVIMLERRLYLAARRLLHRSAIGSLVTVLLMDVAALVLIGLFALIPVGVFGLTVVWASLQ